MEISLRTTSSRTATCFPGTNSSRRSHPHPWTFKTKNERESSKEKKCPQSLQKSTRESLDYTLHVRKYIDGSIFLVERKRETDMGRYGAIYGGRAGFVCSNEKSFTGIECIKLYQLHRKMLGFSTL